MTDLAFSCGTWPAFWFVGTGVWPETGEMDIIEQTNNQPVNIMSLHSSAEPNCSIAGTGQSGKLVTNDCAVRLSHKPAQPHMSMLILLFNSTQTLTPDAPCRPTFLPALHSMLLEAASSPCCGHPKA